MFFQKVELVERELIKWLGNPGPMIGFSTLYVLPGQNRLQFDAVCVSWLDLLWLHLASTSQKRSSAQWERAELQEPKPWTHTCLTGTEPVSCKRGFLVDSTATWTEGYSNSSQNSPPAGISSSSSINQTLRDKVPKIICSMATWTEGLRTPRQKINLRKKERRLAKFNFLWG